MQKALAELRKAEKAVKEATKKAEDAARLAKEAEEEARKAEEELEQIKDELQNAIRAVDWNSVDPEEFWHYNGSVNNARQWFQSNRPDLGEKIDKYESLVDDFNNLFD